MITAKRPATKWVDGWPVMTPLGRRESALLAAELDPGEPVLGQVIGDFGQAMVGTDRRVIVVKTGVRAGLLLGGRALSLSYPLIRGVELRRRTAQGELELRHDGPAESRLSALGTPLPATELPTAVQFLGLDRDAFAAFADRVRERAAGVRAASASPG